MSAYGFSSACAPDGGLRERGDWVSSDPERLSIVVVTRDRFSTTARCVEEILRHTPQPFDLVVVAGGAPARLRLRWEQRFSGQVRFIFEDRYLNPAQSRNIGLRACRTRLAVLMDNDVYVRDAWLEPLLRCQRETSATMVVPLVLEDDKTIHTAGNRLYISYRKGQAFGRKELSFHGMHYYDSCNLTRQPTDYGELHCQLVEVEPALRLGAYDENIQEVGEVDSGLTWQKAQKLKYFEPASVVLYDLPKKVTCVDDIRFFMWRWDLRKILKGYRYFRRKWNMDISDQGTFNGFLVAYNGKLGLLPRLFPSRTALWLDRQWDFVRKIARKPAWLWWRLKARGWGYDDWDSEFEKINR